MENRMADTDIATGLEAVLSQVVIRPRRLRLETPGVAATVPMLRGVWGAALHGLDSEVWQTVFEGRGTGSLRTPGYVLRPAPSDPETAPAIEWVGLAPHSGLMRSCSAPGMLPRAWA